MATEIQKCSLTFSDENVFDGVCIDSAGYKTEKNKIYSEDILRWDSSSSSSSSSYSYSNDALYDWLWSWSTEESGDI